MTLESADDLERFSKQLLQNSVQVTFVIDQANAFDQHPDAPESVETLKEKAEARKLLNRCSSSHILVRGASANNETAKHFRHRQVSAVGETLFLNGGLSLAETGVWLEANESLLNFDDDNDREKLLYYTGCVPLFLFHYLSVVQSRRNQQVSYDFDSCWEQFVQFASLRNISEHLCKNTALLLKKRDSESATFDRVRQFLSGCIAERDVPVGVSPTDYDCRYV